MDWHRERVGHRSVGCIFLVIRNMEGQLMAFHIIGVGWNSENNDFVDAYQLKGVFSSLIRVFLTEAKQIRSFPFPL